MLPFPFVSWDLKSIVECRGKAFGHSRGLEACSRYYHNDGAINPRGGGGVVPNLVFQCRVDISRNLFFFFFVLGTICSVKAWQMYSMLRV